jgi:hypothetical protein
MRGYDFSSSKSHLWTITVVSGLVVSSEMYAAKDFSCGSQNNICVVNDRNITMGDDVGFFTERGELIATGKVTKMSGNKRSVQLRQVMGPVSEQAESYAMLDSPRAIRQDQMKIYRQPSPLAVGGSFGVMTFGAGGDAKGFETSAEIIRRKFLGKVDGFARGSYYTMTGTAYNTAYEMEPSTFKASAMAALGGISYTLFSENDVSLRTELGAGAAYTTAKINNSIDDAKSPDWGYNVRSGFSPHLRGLVALGYKFEGFQIEAGVAPGILAGKTSTAIGAGLLINLK